LIRLPGEVIIAIVVVHLKGIEMVRTYCVRLETDRETGQIIVLLPTLNDLADYGSTVEEALENLKKLAEFALESLQAEGKPLPPSDPVRPGELYLSLEVPAPAPTL
jgi:predicted RNase H-like HicB family nuclease